MNKAGIHYIWSTCKIDDVETLLSEALREDLAEPDVVVVDDEKLARRLEVRRHPLEIALAAIVAGFRNVTVEPVIFVEDETASVEARLFESFRLIQVHQDN
jgi:hypothetical protein